MSPPLTKSQFALALVMVLSGYALVSCCQAECGWRCTWNAWSRTWHTPSALDRPLTPYYTPRTSCYCERGNCAGCGEPAGYWFTDGACDVEDTSIAEGCLPSACATGPPCGFERLGQIPNEFALGVAGAAGAPARQPGR